MKRQDGSLSSIKEEYVQINHLSRLDLNFKVCKWSDGKLFCPSTISAPTWIVLMGKKVTTWLEGTHVCRHSSLQRAICCLLSAQHFSPLTFNLPLFLVFRAPPDSGAENWRQFAVRLMQSYGHRNKSHTCPPPPYTSANTLSPLLTASFFVILNSWLTQDAASRFACLPQEPIRNTAAVHTTALVPLLT